MTKKLTRPRAAGPQIVPQNDGRSALANTILLALPRTERDWVLSKVQFVEIPRGALLNEMAAPIEFGYFINDGLASILNVMGNGKSVEVGLTGKEGFVGLPLIADFTTSPNRVLMQIPGSAYRIDARILAPALRNHLKLEKMLQRYSQELAMQGTQVAACNRLHTVDQRLARWLLMSQDRVGGDKVSLTQEFLAHMLGTRRASVTVSAGRLQSGGLISYQRGDVLIKSRERLE